MRGPCLYCTESVFWSQYTSLQTPGNQACCGRATKPPGSLSPSICADLSSRWFANSKQVPTGLTTALSVHKSPSSAVNHDNAASNSDNLERPCVKMPINAHFPADRFESALLGTVLRSDAANMSPELCDTLLFWTPLEQRLQNKTHLIFWFSTSAALLLPACHAPLCSDWLPLWCQPWSCWADFKIHSNISGLLLDAQHRQLL